MIYVERKLPQKSSEVVLDAAEDAVTDRFNLWLDKGFNIPWSAKLALNWAINPMQRGPVAGITDPTQFSDAFVAWLSEGTVERFGSRFRIKPSRQVPGPYATPTGQPR